jgi:hypothetical protein
MAAILLFGTLALLVGLTGYLFKLGKVLLIIAFMASMAEISYQSRSSRSLWFHDAVSPHFLDPIRIGAS